MESPQMYDSVQSLSQLDLKKAAVAAAAVAVAVGSGQTTLTMANTNSNVTNGTGQQQSNGTNNNSNQSGTVTNSNNSSHHNAALVVKQQQAVHHMQQAAAANNNNNTTTTNNNNNNATNNNNNNNSSILQKHMLQQYAQSDLDELTAQEITLDLQHLIDDQFREQETLGIFGDMVTNQGNPNGNLQANGVVNAAAKVLQLHQQHQQHQQNLRSQQSNQGYSRGALAYMPQAVHSGATYANNSSDENSSIGSETSSNIKEEPIDPQEYRRQLQVNGAAPFLGAAAAAAVVNVNGGNNGLYPITPNAYQPNGNGSSFTTLTPAGVLHHQALPHLTGAHLASLKHHNKQMMPQRKQSTKVVDKGTDEYRRRRERNNIAVRKSREKAKVRSREVEEKVKTLLKEKDALLRRLEEMTNEIQLHKQIYMQLMNHSNPEITRIVRSFLNMNDHGI